MLEATRRIYKSSGVRGFWRGIGPALVLVINPVIQASCSVCPNTSIPSCAECRSTPHLSAFLPSSSPSARRRVESRRLAALSAIGTSSCSAQ